jgi:hypothetical protein
MRNAKVVDRWLGPGAALALGMAMAFFLFAMPLPVMDGAARAIGLDALTPIGAGVRLAVMVAGALAAAIPAWLLFRLLDDRASPAMPWDMEEDDIAWADYADLDDLPDEALPTMRPLSAENDVGEPLLLDTPIEPPLFMAARHDSGDIIRLLDRLEDGLRRRPLARARVADGLHERGRMMPVQPVMDRLEPADDALRSALAELQRIAGQRI